MKTLKDLVLAASEKVVMNEVSNIKEIYPDSTVFESIEEFETHVVDKAVEYLVDNYPDEEEYTSGTWMLSTACNCEGDWIFLIDGEYYIMDYCDWNNEKVDDVQVYIWNNRLNEFHKRLAEELEREVVVEANNVIRVDSLNEIRETISEACYGYFHFSLGMFDNLKLYSNNKDFLEQLPTEFEIYNEKTNRNEVFLCDKDEYGLIKISRPQYIIEASLQEIFHNFTNVEAVDAATYKVKCNIPYIQKIETILEWMKSNSISFLGQGYIDIIATVENREVVDYKILVVILR
ncbi:hypothetical protein NXW80_14590 [Bacteroides fragilis]|nr:hypothetical protein [Bacteroides fragilis]